MWLFLGSDHRGGAAGHLFSLVASARLHRLDPAAYLRDVFRVLDHWPRDRYLELAPKHWARTRARLDPAQLAIEIGVLDVPPPLTPPAAEQVLADLPARRTHSLARRGHAPSLRPSPSGRQTGSVQRLPS